MSMRKHYFKPGRGESEANLRAKISQALLSAQTDIDVVERKVSAFERRLEEILNRLDDLESRVKKLEELLE
mgnify:CR=1 FL=1